MKASIITIGEELLCGKTLNTNAAYLGEKLSELGFDIVGQQSIPDQEASIAAVVRESMSASDLVVLTGGLGPTPDDVTREGIAKAFAVPLLFSKDQSKYRSIMFSNRAALRFETRPYALSIAPLAASAISMLRISKASDSLPQPLSIFRILAPDRGWV